MPAGAPMSLGGLVLGAGGRDIAAREPDPGRKVAALTD